MYQYLNGEIVGIASLIICLICSIIFLLNFLKRDSQKNNEYTINKILRKLQKDMYTQVIEWDTKVYGTTYIFENQKLLEDAKMHMGLYSSTPGFWFKTWINQTKIKRENNQYSLNDFITGYQANVQYWFVFLEDGSYQWLDIKEAIINPDTPMDDETRAVWRAYYEIIEQLKLLPGDLTKLDHLSDNVFRLTVENPTRTLLIDAVPVGYMDFNDPYERMKRFDPIRLQIYSNAAIAKNIGKTTLVSDFFKQAVEMQKNELKKINN